MNNIMAIFKKEFKTYFNSAIAYIYITIFLVLSSYLYFKPLFIVKQSSMRWFFDLIPWLYLFLIPAMTMRLWSEEKKLGTIELILTLPLRDWEVVLGKFLASSVFLLVILGLSLPHIIILKAIGNPDVGPIITAYIGAFLMGMAFASIGQYCSGLTENQIIALVIAVSVSFALFIVGENFVLWNIPEKLQPIFEFIGLGKHYDSMRRGVIDSRDIIYYLSIMVFFLYMNVKTLESRKWQG